MACSDDGGIIACGGGGEGEGRGRAVNEEVDRAWRGVELM